MQEVEEQRPLDVTPAVVWSWLPPAGLALAGVLRVNWFYSERPQECHAEQNKKPLDSPGEASSFPMRRAPNKPSSASHTSTGVKY